MSLTPPSAAAQLAQKAILGGTFAGGLHAVTGPDHLAALLPLCVGRGWARAAWTGATWGIGHGLGAALVGAFAFALRGALQLDVVSAYMEVAVGLSIVIIGATGFREAREWAANSNACPVDMDGGAADAARNEATSGTSGIIMLDGEGDGVEACDAPPEQDVVRTLLNGVLNGVCGTGHILGVMPALAMPNWLIAGAYLSCFGVGTFVAMALFTGVVGELSSRTKLALNDPAAPANLAMASSIVALAMGSVWTSRALAGLGIRPAMLLTRFLAV